LRRFASATDAYFVSRWLFATLASALVCVGDWVFAPFLQELYGPADVAPVRTTITAIGTKKVGLSNKLRLLPRILEATREFLAAHSKIKPTDE
jgi:hypothetical protein